jgi:hypothetical protein
VRDVAGRTQAEPSQPAAEAGRLGEGGQRQFGGDAGEWVGIGEERIFLIFYRYFSFFDSEICGTQSISANYATSALTYRIATAKNVTVFCDSNVKSWFSKKKC